MFNYLKDKIKGAVESFSKKAPEEDVSEEPEAPEEEHAPEHTETEAPSPEPTTEEAPTKQPEKQEETPAREDEPVHEAPDKPAADEDEPDEEPETPAAADKEAAEEPEPEPREEPAEKKKGFFTRLSEKITTIDLSEEQFDDLFWDLEVGLLENNVALEVIERIKHDLKEELTTGRTARGNLQERILRRLEETLREVLEQDSIDLLASTQENHPLVIAAIGVNGSGKTTTLAKLGRYFQDNNKSVLYAACDTFRAAAIQQLEEHANNLNAPIIKQEYGSDAAAVAYDAIEAAKARDIDVVLIDTAGRLHSNTNLMDELEKVMRIAKPHHTIFVGESTTGNDCVEQARKFSEKIRVDAVILTKADVDENGGAAISVSYVTDKPILFLGVGQEYADLEAFDKETILEQVLAEN